MDFRSRCSILKSVRYYIGIEYEGEILAADAGIMATRDFNLLGIFAGHIHRNSIEMIKGKPQIVADDNASGGYLDINFLPMNEADKKLIL